MTDIAAGAHASRAARLEQAIVLLAALSWTAALIHAVVVPEHWTEYRPYGICFAVLAAAQAAWSIALFRRPARHVLRAGAALSAGVIVVWALSRTTGLPVGPSPWTAEPVGRLDLAATLVELAIVAAGTAFWRRWPEIDITPSALRAGSAVLVTAGVALTLGGHTH